MSSTTHSFEACAPRIVGRRSRQLVERFGIADDLGRPRRRPRTDWLAMPAPGRLMQISGASGSGKTSLLKAIVRRARRRGIAIIDLARVRLEERPIIELFDERHEAAADLAATLKQLARVGLAEVWTWLRPPSQLSEGQRWRLRVALAIHQASRAANRPTLLVCDEFAAVLDRVSARIVATVLRRAVDANAQHLAAVVATSHDDLHESLDAETMVNCDFGEVSVTVNAKRLLNPGKPR